MLAPPSGYRATLLVPNRGWNVRDGYADAEAAGQDIATPFGRGKVETKASGMTHGEARTTDIVAHLRGGLPRGTFVHGLTTLQRQIHSVDELRLGSQVAEVLSKIPSSTTAVSEDRSHSLGRKRAVSLLPT